MIEVKGSDILQVNEHGSVEGTGLLSIVRQVNLFPKKATYYTNTYLSVILAIEKNRKYPT